MCTPRAQLPKTNNIGGPRPYTGHQESTHKTGVVPGGNRAAHGDNVQGACQKDVSRDPVASCVDVDVAAGGQVEPVVFRGYSEG